MMPHEQNPPTPMPLPTTDAPPTGGKGLLPMVALGLVLALLIGGILIAQRGNPGGQPGDTGGAEESVPPDTEYPVDHRQWEKPLLALVVSGQLHGYVDPCGCTAPQYGGLTRRYNLVQSLHQKKWDVAGIDLGELPQLKGIREQNLLKYELSVKALNAMNYAAMGLGRDEILMPLGDALTQIWDQKTVYPRPLLLTLADAAPGELFYKQLNTRQWEIFQAGKLKVGVINMMGPDLRDELQAKAKFLANMVELPNALAEFAEAGVQVGVILHHEYPNLPEAKFPKGGIARLKAVDAERDKQAELCAKFCADARKTNPKIPPIQLMMVLTEEPEPPSFLKEYDKLPTRVVEIGHKGKYVGLVGIYADKAGYRLQYQRVLMGPELDTPKGKEKDNKVTQLMERYYQVLQKQNMLDRFPRAPHANQVEPAKQGLTATYVGSNACRNCHKEAFNVWNNPKEKVWHHVATDTLEKEKFPSGRQHDPECMRCHTTGFAHPGGYNHPVPDLAAWQQGKKQDVAAPQLLAHNMKMRGVGCESCHGPASEHVKKMNLGVDPNAQERLAINPYRPTDEERKLENVAKRNPNQQVRLNQLFQTRMDALNRFCIQCHDTENDVHWLNKGVNEKWLKIIHRTQPVPNVGAGVAPMPKAVEPPPIVIEVIDEKKK